MKAQTQLLKMLKQIAAHANDAVVADANLVKTLGKTKQLAGDANQQHRRGQNENLPKLAGGRDADEPAIEKRRRFVP